MKNYKTIITEKEIDGWFKKLNENKNKLTENEIMLIDSEIYDNYISQEEKI